MIFQDDTNPCCIKCTSVDLLYTTLIKYSYVNMIFSLLRAASISLSIWILNSSISSLAHLGCGVCILHRNDNMPHFAFGLWLPDTVVPTSSLCQTVFLVTVLRLSGLHNSYSTSHPFCSGSNSLYLPPISLALNLLLFHFVSRAWSTCRFFFWINCTTSSWHASDTETKHVRSNWNIALALSEPATIRSKQY